MNGIYFNLIIYARLFTYANLKIILILKKKLFDLFVIKTTYQMCCIQYVNSIDRSNCVIYVTHY